MSYSDQTSGESLSRGHYQTIPRDFKPLNLPLEPQAKRNESFLMEVAVLILIKRMLMGLINERYWRL